MRSRFLGEVSQRGWCFGHHGKQKKLQRERERKSAKERAHRKKDRHRRRKTEKEDRE